MVIFECIYLRTIFSFKKISVLRLEARSLINLLFGLQINTFTFAKIMIILKNNQKDEGVKLTEMFFVFFFC